MTHDTTPRALADFAPTQLLFRADARTAMFDDGFAPTQILLPEPPVVSPWYPATRLAPSGGWPFLAAERTVAAQAVVATRPAPRAPWLGRLEALIGRVIPGGFGSLLGLFLCVSMSIVLISAMLPLVDRA